MISSVSIGDVAVKIAQYRDFKITHDDLVEWSRAAMMAVSIPPSQVDEVMELLMDIRKSTPIAMRRALADHEKLMCDVVKEGDELIFRRR